MNKNNLSIVRLFAAFLVLYSHSSVLLGLHEPTFCGLFSLGALGVYTFFSISGYLVAKSWDNDPCWYRFISKRILRIFPGLIVCILVTIYIIGPIMTTMSFENYISDPSLYRYFYNIILYMTYLLPGVFSGNPIPSVNGSLWSLPVEFFMYILIVIFGLLSIKKMRLFILTCIFICVSFFWAQKTEHPVPILGNDLRMVFIWGSYFLCGILFYQYDIKKYFTLTNTCLIILVWSILYSYSSAAILISHIIIPFAILSFGLTESYFGKFSDYDYSYGLYIYAFPIQQSFIHFFPTISFNTLVFASTVTVLVLSACSWHFIEKPCLSFKPTRKKNSA